MCELLGVTSKKKLLMNTYFKCFFSHSAEHRNGWGLAIFDNSPAFLEKESVKAVDSPRLKKILANDIKTAKCIAHIRKASIGAVNDENAHPFTKQDDYGRVWTLAHNGTIFDSDILAPYQYVQKGSTDSERILFYIVDRINTLHKRNEEEPDGEERMHIVEDVIKNIAPGNKVNLLIYDGEYFYVHNNDPGTLYMKENEDGVLFFTKPNDSYGWKEVPSNRLLVYKDGNHVYTGKRHDSTYIHDESKMGLVYLEYSSL